MNKDKVREAVEIWQDERTTITIEKLKALQLLLDLAHKYLSGVIVDNDQ